MAPWSQYLGITHQPVSTLAALRFPLGNNNTCPCSRQLCSQQVEEHSAQCPAQNRHLMPLYVGLRWGAQRVNRL